MDRDVITSPGCVILARQPQLRLTRIWEDRRGWEKVMDRVRITSSSEKETVSFLECGGAFDRQVGARQSREARHQKNAGKVAKRAKAPHYNHSSLSPCALLTALTTTRRPVDVLPPVAKISSAPDSLIPTCTSSSITKGSESLTRPPDTKAWPDGV